MTNQQRWQKLSGRLDEIAAYERSLGKLEFDMECCAPPRGLRLAGEDMSQLGRQLHRLRHAKPYRELLEALHTDSTGLGPAERRVVEQLWRSYEREKKVPARLAFELDRVSNRAYGDWLAAKQANDFGLFRDSFAALVDNTRTLVALRERSYPSPYDACLDDMEPGSSIARLDAFFEALKARIVPLLARIRREGRPIRDEFLSRPVPAAQQERFSRWLLEQEGLRADALVLMTTEHPFTTAFGAQDVRVTTHYYEDRFLSSIFSTLHEGGHALLMQNEPAENAALHCENFASNAQHECISRFYENLVGRSRGFLHYLTPQLRAVTGELFADVSEEELYRAVNRVRPGLLRMEADELCYCLHILIRYELEKAFVNGEITVDEVPALWREKYRLYLGVEVPDDARGCLQDVHWTGAYGYFPSYALGNAYGVQILRRMERDFDVEAALREGRLQPIRDWLCSRVFSIVSLQDPDEWLRSITGESLNVDYYLDYLEEKYTALYCL